MIDHQKDAIEAKRLDVQLDWLNKQEQMQMKNFKDLVKSLDEAKFKLPRGEQEVDSYMETGKRVQPISKKSNKFKVYVDGQELATYKMKKKQERMQNN